MTAFNTSKGPVEIHELRTIAEMVAAEQIQLAVWGADIIPTPKEILIPVQHEGGLLAGAFSPSGAMVGLVFSFPTSNPAIMHSHMLATLAGWRGLGIGAQMKWFQRAWCLEHGITLVRWTVDPLRAANAELNIRRLGGTAATYLPDFYGAMQGIDAGAPTDRLLVEWRLDSQRVAARCSETPQDRGFPEAKPANAIEDGRPAHASYDLDCPRALIRLPEDFMQIARSNPALALEWRMHTREIFQHYFANGYEISEFTRAGGPAYLMLKRSDMIGS